MKTKDFASAVKQAQIQWAVEGNLPSGALLQRNGKATWVLQPEYRERNLYRASWWSYIAGREHRWVSALNSSQCFGVNLFAPLADRQDRAVVVLRRLFPDRGISEYDRVQTHFEWTPREAPSWLGERGQPTQVDVCFEISRDGQLLGFILVEVKFTESEFGACRGWHGKRDGQWTNPDRTGCCDTSRLVASPTTQCWLSKVEGRHYWDLMGKAGSSIRTDSIRPLGSCPFQDGLYQLMRNRILADELARRTGAWTEVAVCRHPDNHVLMHLEQPVAASDDPLEAFDRISFPGAVKHWNARQVADAIADADLLLVGWKDWVERRYFPRETR